MNPPSNATAPPTAFIPHSPVSKPAEARHALHASGSIAAHPSYTPQGPQGASEGVDGGRVYASIAGALAVVATKSAGAVAAAPRPLASTWTPARSRGSQRTRNSALGGEQTPGPVGNVGGTAAEYTWKSENEAKVATPSFAFPPRNNPPTASATQASESTRAPSSPSSG